MRYYLNLTQAEKRAQEGELEPRVKGTEQGMKDELCRGEPERDAMQTWRCRECSVICREV